MNLRKELEYMEHFRVLLDQHKAVRQLLQTVQKQGSSKERVDLIRQIQSEVNSHTVLEENHVYPVLENYEPLKKEVFSFWREHQKLRQEIQNLMSIHQDERQFQTVLGRVNQMFEEHIRDEENQIFPEACKVIPKDQLQKIDQQLQTAIEQTRKVA